MGKRAKGEVAKRKRLVQLTANPRQGIAGPLFADRGISHPKCRLGFSLRLRAAANLHEFYVNFALGCTNVIENLAAIT